MVFSKKIKMISNKTTLAIIPARCGSKSIPFKNIVDLCGKPLIAYSIESAIESEVFEDLIVSTDCEEIASISKKLGARVPFMRPSKIATDSSSSLSVVQHCLEFLEKEEDKKYDFVMLLQPTNPMRKVEWIKEALRMLEESPKFDSVVSIVDVGAIHPHRMYQINSDKSLNPFVENIKNPMLARQELPRVYIRSGDIYLTRVKCIQEKKSLIGDKSLGMEVKPLETVNIDELDDLIIASNRLSSN